jgi:hypothetical protein
MWSPTDPHEPPASVSALAAAPRPRKQDVVLLTGLTLAATAVVGVISPYHAGRYPVCPLYAVTGLYCPLCGGLRATHDLTRLDVTGALDRNPLVVLAVPFVLYAWIRWVRRAWTGSPGPLSVPRSAGWGLLALVITFTVLRNVPGWTWLSPA